jgi:uncharacterized protein (TIGR00251 family)
VIPRAPRTRVDGTRDGAVLIRLAAPPVDGAANDALIAFLADALELPRRNIRIVAGEKSRDKRVHVAGIDEWRAADASCDSTTSDSAFSIQHLTCSSSVTSVS